MLTFNMYNILYKHQFKSYLYLDQIERRTKLILKLYT